MSPADEVLRTGSTQHNAYVPDTVCGECGYFVHAPTCPTRVPKADPRVGSNSIALGSNGGCGFAVGDLVRCVRPMSEMQHRLGCVARVTEADGLLRLEWGSAIPGMPNSGRYTATQFERVPADELPPGWLCDPRVKPSKHKAVWYEPRGYATDDACPAVARHTDGTWYVLRDVRGNGSFTPGLSLHAVMAEARGLARIEQLWDAASSDGSGGVGRPGADAPRAPAAAVAGTSGKSTSGGAPLGQVAPSLRPQLVVDPACPAGVAYFLPNSAQLVVGRRWGKTHAARTALLDALEWAGYSDPEEAYQRLLGSVES